MQRQAQVQDSDRSPCSQSELSRLRSIRAASATRDALRHLQVLFGFPARFAHRFSEARGFGSDELSEFFRRAAVGIEALRRQLVRYVGFLDAFGDLRSQLVDDRFRSSCGCDDPTQLLITKSL